MTFGVRLLWVQGTVYWTGTGSHVALFTFDVPVRYISAIGAIRGAGLALSPYSVGDRLD